MQIRKQFFLCLLDNLGPVVVNLAEANVISVGGGEFIDKGTESGITDSILYSMA
jgi:hypothetical protein